MRRADGIEHLPPVRARAFTGLVRSAESLVRDLDAELQAAHGIGLRAFEVLLHLAAFSDGGCLRMSQLSRQAPLSQSRVSRLVADLDARGLVARSTAVDDSRGVDVTITDRGVALFRAAQATHLAGLDARFFSRLTWKETAELARITAKLLASDADGE